MHLNAPMHHFYESMSIIHLSNIIHREADGKDEISTMEWRTWKATNGKATNIVLCRKSRVSILVVGGALQMMNRDVKQDSGLFKSIKKFLVDDSTWFRTRGHVQGVAIDPCGKISTKLQNCTGHQFESTNANLSDFLSSVGIAIESFGVKNHVFERVFLGDNGSIACQQHTSNPNGFVVIVGLGAHGIRVGLPGYKVEIHLQIGDMAVLAQSVAYSISAHPNTMWNPSMMSHRFITILATQTMSGKKARASVDGVGSATGMGSVAGSAAGSVAGHGIAKRHHSPRANGAFNIGDSVEVLWYGMWYSAVVLHCNRHVGRYQVQYIGNGWDGYKEAHIEEGNMRRDKPKPNTESAEVESTQVKKRRKVDRPKVPSEGELLCS